MFALLVLLSFKLGTAEAKGVSGNVTAGATASSFAFSPSRPTGTISPDKKKRCPQWEPTLKNYGLVPVETFSYIMWRESRCNPKSQNASWDKNGNMTSWLNSNKSFDTGLLQINSSWRTVTKQICGVNAVNNHMAGLKDPDCNLRVAKYILDNTKGGLRNWRITSGVS
jgi:hypothetical protein